MEVALIEDSVSVVLNIDVPSIRVQTNLVVSSRPEVAEFLLFTTGASAV